MTHHDPIALLRCTCPMCAFGTLRGVASGTLWAHGRDAARDAAQVLVLRRMLEVAA